MNPYKSAFGFSLDREEFEKIAKDEILSFKHFVNHCYYKKMQQKHDIESIEGKLPEKGENENDIEDDSTLDNSLGKQIEILRKNVNNLELDLLDFKSRVAKKII